MRHLCVFIAVVAVAPPALAQAADPLSPIVDLFSKKRAIGENPKIDPPMDAPPLPWIEYGRDGLGRPTYLDAKCLSTARDYSDPCVQAAILKHHQEVEERQIQDRLASERAALAAKAKAQADAADRQAAEERAWREAQPKLTPLQASELEVRRLKQELVGAQKAIDDENEIGRVSGVVNKQTLYTYGQMVVFTRRSLLREYDRYRKLGGRKPLAAI